MTKPTELNDVASFSTSSRDDGTFPQQKRYLFWALYFLLLGPTLPITISVLLVVSLDSTVDFNYFLSHATKVFEVYYIGYLGGGVPAVMAGVFYAFLRVRQQRKSSGIIRFNQNVFTAACAGFLATLVVYVIECFIVFVLGFDPIPFVYAPMFPSEGFFGHFIYWVIAYLASGCVSAIICVSIAEIFQRKYRVAN